MLVNAGRAITSINPSCYAEFDPRPLSILCPIAASTHSKPQLCAQGHLGWRQVLGAAAKERALPSWAPIPTVAYPTPPSPVARLGECEVSPVCQRRVHQPRRRPLVLPAVGEGRLGHAHGHAGGRGLLRALQTAHHTRGTVEVGF
jgi:hypothetical protein